MKDSIKLVSNNKKASHDFFLEERYECGIQLVGTEIKAIRLGHCQLKDAFVSIISKEAFIKGMLINAYEFGNRFNHDETRERKLLLHRSEIKKLENKVKLKGYTIIPTRLYLKGGRAKLEIALAKGKDLHDKRQSDKEKDAKREIEKALKNQF